MINKIIWIVSPAFFSVIGMIAGYLNNADYTVLSVGAGFVVGFAVAAFALAGDKTKTMNFL